MNKHAQHQVRMEAFNDELHKIAAEDILGYTPDWNNLSEEDIEKIAKIGDGKFLNWLGKTTGKITKGIREGNIGQGLRQAGRGILGTLGIQTPKMKETNYDYGLKDVFGGGARAVVGGTADAVSGIARGTGNAIEGAGKFFGNLKGKFKEGFQEGQGDLNLSTPGDKKPVTEEVKDQNVTDEKKVTGDDTKVTDEKIVTDDKKVTGDEKIVTDDKKVTGDDKIITDDKKVTDEKKVTDDGKKVDASDLNKKPGNDLNQDGVVNVLDMVQMINKQNKEKEQLAGK